jgi:hypothetical protein
MILVICPYPVTGCLFETKDSTKNFRGNLIVTPVLSVNYECTLMFQLCAIALDFLQIIVLLPLVLPDSITILLSKQGRQCNNLVKRGAVVQS